MQLDPLGMSSNPGADQLGPMHRMAVHDQVHPPPAAIAQQPAEEVDEDGSGEGPGEQPEPQPAGFGDGADHVDPEPLAGRLTTGV